MRRVVVTGLGAVSCLGNSQAEIWLEIVTDDIEAAAKHLKYHECVRCDEIETLPNDFRGFWVSSPSNIIHLINE